MLRRRRALLGTLSRREPAVPGPWGGEDAAPAPRYGLGNPVVVILLLAGFFDGISGNPVGGALLAVVGLVLARARVEDYGPAPVAPGPPAPPATVPAWVVAPVIAVYALLAGAPERFSWPATLAVVVPGLAVVVAARRPLLRRRPLAAPRPVGTILWAMVLVGLAVWELINLLLQPSFTTGSWEHPTLSVLADPVFASHAGRSAGLAVWAGAGWYLVRR